MNNKITSFVFKNFVGMWSRHKSWLSIKRAAVSASCAWFKSCIAFKYFRTGSASALAANSSSAAAKPLTAYLYTAAAPKKIYVKKLYNIYNYIFFNLVL